MEEVNKDFGDFLSAFRRRRSLLVMSAIGLFGLALIVALLWPPTYKSSATILIEAQEIPSDLVRSTITSYASQRIQTTSQRVMTRTSLLEVIEKYNLYANRRQRETTEEIVERMREDISLDMISADVVDPRTGRPATAAIAFTLSYEGDKPKAVQQVASELTGLYLSQNLKTRTEEAANTVVFLSHEAERLEEELAAIDGRLAEFKEQHSDSLPTLAGMNMTLLQRAETDLRQAEADLQQLEDRRFYLENQLKLTQPYGSQDELAAVRSAYIRAKAQYAPNHPDVIRLGKQVSALESEEGTVSNIKGQLREAERLRGELAVARERYSPGHPDVKKLEKALASVEAELRKNEGRVTQTETAERMAENPLYLSIKEQLATVESTIASRKLLEKSLRAKLADYERRLTAAPQVEREYLALTRDRENTEIRYRQTHAKHMEAKVAQELEAESKGERFVLIDPAQMPEAPIRPNRPVILFLGFVLALGGSVGVTAVAEAMDKSIRGVKGVVAAFQMVPLAVIPLQETIAERHTRHRKKYLMLAALLGAIVVVLLVIHFFFTPLDVLWFRGLRKAEKMLPV